MTEAYLDQWGAYFVKYDEKLFVARAPELKSDGRFDEAATGACLRYYGVRVRLGDIRDIALAHDVSTAWYLTCRDRSRIYDELGLKPIHYALFSIAAGGVDTQISRAFHSPHRVRHAIEHQRRVSCGH